MFTSPDFWFVRFQNPFLATFWRLVGQESPNFLEQLFPKPREAGALGALVVALQRHVDDAPLRRAACCALGMICSGEDASDHSRAARAVEVRELQIKV